MIQFPCAMPDSDPEPVRTTCCGGESSRDTVVQICCLCLILGGTVMFAEEAGTADLDPLMQGTVQLDHDVAHALNSRPPVPPPMIC